MTPTYNLTSLQVPKPTLSSTTFPANSTLLANGFLTGSSGPFSQGMVSGVSTALNQQTAKILALCQFGGGGSGVLTGLLVDIAPAGGLTITCGSGSGFAGDVITIFTPIFGVLPANLLSFVWLTFAGGLAWNQDPTVIPSGGAVFLAAVQTSSSSVTNIDYSGRISIYDGFRIRTTSDPFEPQDSPLPGTRFITNTAAGSYFWTGVAHHLMGAVGNQIPNPTRVMTVTGPLTLVPTDANLQWLVPNAFDQIIKLPNPLTVHHGSQFTIVNAGDPTIPGQNHNLNIQDFAGSALVTLTPGKRTSIAPTSASAGTLAWPISAVAI